MIIGNWWTEGKKWWTQFCAIKVGYPAEVHTHTTYYLQETEPLVWPTAAAFDKVQVQRIHCQIDHDKFSNKMLETYENVLFPNIGNFKIISKQT